MLSHSPSIVTDGLVLCLDAANPRSYGGSGTNWGDLSGNGNNGTLVNGPTYSGDSLGYFNFDKSNDYVDLGNIYDNLNNFTIEAVVSNNYSQGGILSKGLVNNSTEWGVVFGYSNPLRLVCRPRGYPQQITVVWTPYSTGFHNISYCVSGSSYHSVYIDGTLITTNILTVSPGSTVGNLLIGQHGTSYNFGGKISKVSLYNRALSPQEIEQNFKATRGRFGI